MKTLKLLPFCFMLISLVARAQQTKEEFIKKIDVTGVAEMEIVPDEIYFTIVLEEYLKEKDKKAEIQTLEKDLINAVKEAGIQSEDLQIENIFGQNWVYKKKKQKDFLEKKQYVLKLKDPSKIDQVLDKLDQRAIENVYISKYWHSKMEDYKKQMKIQAIKNSKEKALYLLTAIDEQLGEAIYIRENNMDVVPVTFDLNPQIYNQRSYSGLAYNEEGGFDVDLSFKKIKIRFEIMATYRIK